MSHSVNKAVRDLIATGIPFSASVMVPCPWFAETVEILNQAPHVSVRLHLTLTSEFRQYKWGPVIDNSLAPSLAGKEGYFHPSVRAFLQNNYQLDDIEAEVHAQVEHALQAGLKVEYLDHHMVLYAPHLKLQPSLKK